MPQDLFRSGLGKVWAAVARKALLKHNLMILSVCFLGCELISPPIWISEYWSPAKTQLESTIMADYCLLFCLVMSSLSDAEMINSCWCYSLKQVKGEKKRKNVQAPIHPIFFSTLSPLPQPPLNPLFKLFVLEETTVKLSQFGSRLVIMDSFLSLDMTTALSL